MLILLYISEISECPLTAQFNCKTTIVRLLQPQLFAQSMSIINQLQANQHINFINHRSFQSPFVLRKYSRAPMRTIIAQVETTINRVSYGSCLTFV